MAALDGKISQHNNQAKKQQEEPIAQQKLYE